MKSFELWGVLIECGMDHNWVNRFENLKTPPPNPNSQSPIKSFKQTTLNSKKSRTMHTQTI
jgi:hypothetical protein